MINDCVLDLSQYKIKKTLGNGGGGIVFLVEDKDGNKFAAKIIKKTKYRRFTEWSKQAKFTDRILSRDWIICKN